MIAVRVAAGDGHAGQGHVGAGEDVEDAVMAIGIDGGVQPACAVDGQVFQDVQVAGTGRVLARRAQRWIEGVGAGRQGDGVGAVARLAVVDGEVAVGGADGFAQRAVAVAVVLVVGGGHGDGGCGGRRDAHVPDDESGQKGGGDDSESQRRPASRLGTTQWGSGDGSGVRDHGCFSLP